MLALFIKLACWPLTHIFTFDCRARAPPDPGLVFILLVISPSENVARLFADDVTDRFHRSAAEKLPLPIRRKLTQLFPLLLVEVVTVSEIRMIDV